MGSFILGPMKRRAARRRKKASRPGRSSRSKPLGEPVEDDRELISPWLSDWLALTPGERLRRAWRLRKHIKNLPELHDAKTLPVL